MLSNPKVQLGVFGAAFIILIVYLVVVFSSGEHVRTPEELVEIALGDAPEDEREMAAAELARHGDKPLAEIRQVFSESDSPRVKVAVASGLVQLDDWDSVPAMLEFMETTSGLERERMGAVVLRQLRITYQFPRADAPDAKWEKAIDQIKHDWKQYRKLHERKAEAQAKWAGNS